MTAASARCSIGIRLVRATIPNCENLRGSRLKPDAVPFDRLAWLRGPVAAGQRDRQAPEARSNQLAQPSRRFPPGSRRAQVDLRAANPARARTSAYPLAGPDHRAEEAPSR